MTQLLFSYGTLQQRDVQLATFGRELHGTPDHLVGFRQSMVRIEDPEVVKTSGKTHHPIVSRSDVAEDRIAGTVFKVSDEELAKRREEQNAIGWKPAKPRPRKVSAALKAYAKFVMSADKGAVRDLSLLED